MTCFFPGFHLVRLHVLLSVECRRSIAFNFVLSSPGSQIAISFTLSLYLFVSIRDNLEKNYSTKLYQDAIKYEKLGTKNEKSMLNDNGKKVKKLSSDSSNRVNRRTGKRQTQKKQKTKHENLCLSENDFFSVQKDVQICYDTRVYTTTLK